MRKFLIAALLSLLAACASPEPAPPPAPPPPPAAPPPPPRPATISQDWRDWPLTPGTWVYRSDAAGSSAMFGRAGVEADLILRCDLPSRTVILSWPGPPLPGGNPVTITTSEGSAAYRGSGDIGLPGRIGVKLPTNNPFLDKLAFSRGRFVVTVEDPAATPMVAPRRLVIPAWPEPARAIEDCRK